MNHNRLAKEFDGGLYDLLEEEVGQHAIVKNPKTLVRTSGFHTIVLINEDTTNTKTKNEIKTYAFEFYRDNSIGDGNLRVWSTLQDVIYENFEVHIHKFYRKVTTNK